MNATTKSLLRVGNSKCSVSPELEVKNVSDAMDQRLKICSDSKVVEIKTNFFVMYNKTIYVTLTKYYIILEF